MNKTQLIVAWVIVFSLFLFNKISFADVIILEDGSLFEGETVSSNKFKVEGGYAIFFDPVCKVISVEKRSLTDKEKQNFIVFKTQDYDVTFNEKGDYSASLTSFEEKVGKRMQEVFDKYQNLSEKACIEMVAKEFNLPPTIVDQIFLKAALLTGGRL